MGLFNMLLYIFKSDKYLHDSYDKERKRWANTGYNGDGSHTRKMNRLDKEMCRRSAKKWKKDPRRSKDPNFRWTDANRWDRD